MILLLPLPFRRRKDDDIVNQTNYTPDYIHSPLTCKCSWSYNITYIPDRTAVLDQINGECRRRLDFSLFSFPFPFFFNPTAWGFACIPVRIIIFSIHGKRNSLILTVRDNTGIQPSTVPPPLLIGGPFCRPTLFDGLKTFTFNLLWLLFSPFPFSLLPLFPPSFPSLLPPDLLTFFPPQIVCFSSAFIFYTLLFPFA